MKEENIKKTGKIVIGLTAAASTIASVVGYYYTSQACLKHFVYNNKTRTAEYSEKVDIAICYYFPFIMTPVTVILTSYISFKSFFGLSSDITKPFDNTNHGLAKCLKDNDDQSNDSNDDSSMTYPQLESSGIYITHLSQTGSAVALHQFELLDQIVPQPAQPAGTMEPDTQTHTDQEVFNLFRNNIDHVDEEQPDQPASTMEQDAPTHTDQESSMIDEEMVHLEIYEPQPAAQPAQPADYYDLA